MSRNLILFAAAAILAAACTKPAPPAAEKTATTDLPEDVAALAQPAAAAPAPAAAPASAEATAAAPGAPSSPDVAGGMLQTTGEFVSPTKTDLAPKNAGRVAAVYADEGDRVRKGQVLLRQETEYAALDLTRAQADLARFQAAEGDARRELERKRELLAKESTPKATFDRAEAAYSQAQAATAAARAAVDLAKRKVADSALVSPVTGVITERRSVAGEHLGSDNVAFVILQTAPLKLRFSVPERYLAAVHRGQTVTAEADPYPGETFRGEIQTIGGTIDPQTRTFFAEAAFANADGRLRPGLFARVRLPLAGKAR